MLLGKRIAAARERRGWNKADLARRSGVSRSYVSRVEAGDFKKPSIALINAIAESLSVDLSALTDPPPVADPDDTALLRRLIEKRLGNRANAPLVEAIIDRLRGFGPLDHDGTLDVLDVILPRMSTDR